MSARVITPRNTLSVAVLVALTLSWIYTTMGQPKYFEDRLAYADAVASAECDIDSSTLRNGPAAAAAVCAEWGRDAYSYAEKYPEATPRLFALYGNLPEWHEVLDRYGHGVIPVVWSFYLEGSVMQQTEHDVGRAVRSILAGQMPTFDSETLTPIEHGAYAIMRIEQDGYDVLARYEVVNGDVGTKPLTSTLRAVEGLLLGGVKKVERKFVRGEEMTAGDVGFAALDVAILAVGGNAIISGLKKSGVAATTKAVAAKGFAAKTAVVLKATGIGAGKSLLAVGRKVAPYAVVGGVAYLAVTDPMLVVSAGGWVLEQAGVSSLLALPIAATLFAIFAWAVLWTLSWPVRRAYRSVRYAFHTT